MTLAEPPEVQVTEHGIPIRNVWHMLLYIWNRQLSRDRWRSEVEKSPTLDSLLANVLAAEMEQRLRIGLGREYVVTDSRLRAIRGRIDFNRSLLQQLFERGEAHCQYDTYAVDAPRNQIIKSVLTRLIRVGSFGDGALTGVKELKHRLRMLVRDLDGVAEIDVTPSLIRRQQLGRNDRDYELMLNICLFLLQNSLLTEQEGATSTLQLNREELTLFQVFEQFVAAFYQHHLHGWRVRKQAVLSWPVMEQSSRLPTMQPDLILEAPLGERLMILDTKFTANSLAGWRGSEPKYSSEHLYQLYSYLRSQEDRSPAHREAVGILLYPTVETALSDSFTVQGHEVRIESVDLAAGWEEIEAELMAVIHGDSERVLEVAASGLGVPQGRPLGSLRPARGLSAQKP